MFQIFGDANSAVSFTSEGRSVLTFTQSGSIAVTGSGTVDVLLAGGGRVRVAPGVYPSGSIRLRSRVDLHLEKGAELRGDASPDAYFDIPDAVCAVKPEGSAKAFLYAWDEEDVAITGEGVVNGQGPAFFDQTLNPKTGFWPKPPPPRPRIVQLVRCKRVKLAGATFRDSPGWTMLIRLCDDLDADGIHVLSDRRMINSDGIDIDGCRRVRIANADFATGDDCLILRAMRERKSDSIVCEDVLVTNCTLDSACQTIRRAVFRDIRAKGRNGIFFDYPVRYLRSDDEGHVSVSDLLFENYSGAFTESALQIVVEPGVKIRGVSDVTFRDFDIASAGSLRFIGNAGSVLANIRLENVRATVAQKPACQIQAVASVFFENCVINGGSGLLGVRQRR
ncbi:MAG: glycoside hydrolase family 28 protein [Kiritimatiellia bacterium]